MKQLKMLGAAVLAAMGLMALVGAGTASATTLFTSSNLTNPYWLGTEIHGRLAFLEDFVFTYGSGENLAWCRETTIRGSVGNETGSTVSMSISTLTLGSCTTTFDVLATGSLSIEKTGTNEGKVVGAGTQITVQVFGVSCTYGTGTGTTLGTIAGGVEPQMNIAAVGLTKTAGGFLCPSSVGLDTGYTFGTPHALFIGA